MPKINVKCGPKLLNVDVNLDLPPVLLKAQLFELTEIPPERQKLLIKGKTIGDDSWEGYPIKDGATIMLVGGVAPTNVQSTNGDEKAGEPGAKTKQNDVVALPVGLKNLGNTCYMNATLQCFKIIPELDAAIQKCNEQPSSIVNMLKKLYADMDRMKLQQQQSASADDENAQHQFAVPLFFLHVLHQHFPQFATQDERGGFQQQDANECFCEILRVVTDAVKYQISSAGSTSTSSPEGTHQMDVPMKKFFEIEFEVTSKCKEEACTEEPVKSNETHFQLNCYLSQDVRYIQTGIKSKMSEEIEKQSATLGRNAVYEKRSLISRLPMYLPVQIVRFYYKEEIKVNAKILKDVKFPIVLDIFDMCTPALQEKLKPARQALKDYDEAKEELLKKAKLGEDVEKETKLKGYFPNTFADDLGSNNSGIYELKALITHKGRASNHGHYVAWVRVAEEDEGTSIVHKPGEMAAAKWAACDDDEVYMVSEEQILKLSGGGDWHCAYVLLYGPKKIPQL